MAERNVKIIDINALTDVMQSNKEYLDKYANVYSESVNDNEDIEFPNIDLSGNPITGKSITKVDDVDININTGGTGNVNSIGIYVERHESGDGGDVLKIYGHEQLLEDGYVPYIWRYIVKSSRKKSDGGFDNYRLKGWITYGSYHCVNITEDNIIEFSTNESYKLNNIADDYSSYASNLIKPGKSAEIGHGRRGLECHLGLKMKFAIGFARPKHLRERLTTADLVSNLAEFYVVYGSSDIGDFWSYGLNRTL